MQAMKDFVLWFIAELPSFLMSEPICYFVGIAFALVIVGVIKSIVNINRF